MSESADDPYASFVEHPRYGRSPRITGKNPDPTDLSQGVHWNALSSEEKEQLFKALRGLLIDPSNSLPGRIPDTAVQADETLQVPATMPVTWYYDLPRKCRSCSRPFLFFAEEQKYWYETLGLLLEADAVRCVPCRKNERDLAKICARYGELITAPDRSWQADLDAAECSLTLMENGIFNRRQTERVRALLKSVPGDHDTRDFLKRVKAIEFGS